MLLNIYGPSGSGKTTFIKYLMQKKIVELFFSQVFNINQLRNKNSKLGISLMPIPQFSGSFETLFELFSIELGVILNERIEIINLTNSIFGREINSQNLGLIAKRNVETLSAGELRRLFILKSLLTDSEIVIVDEPFSNSDEKLWDIIFKALNTKSKIITLSHIPLSDNFDLKKNDKVLQIKDLREKFIYE